VKFLTSATFDRLNDAAMIASHVRGKWIPIAVVLGVAAVAFLVIECSGPRHPEFGRIYQAHFEEGLRGWKKIMEGPLRPLFPNADGCMRFGSTVLVWSLASDVSSPKCGHLYFGDRANEWEFAPCRQTRVIDVTWQDLDCQFYGKQDPRGTQAFGDSWQPFTIVVAEGQILLARTVANPSDIYVLRMAKQGGDPGSIFIEYAKASAQARPNNRDPSNSR